MKRSKRMLNFSEELINNLSILGLNKYESSIWLALLTKSNATASELSEVANVPRSRSYDVLESLEKKGFVMTKIGKPIKYVAVSPSLVLNKVKKNIEHNSLKKIDSIDQIKGSDLFDELNSLYTTNNSNDEFVVLLKGRINAYNTINHILASAENEVIIVTSKEGLKRKTKYFADSLKSLAKRNISVKFVTPKLSSKDQLKSISKFDHFQTNHFNSRFIIIDGKHTFIGMEDKNDKFESFDQFLHISSEFLSNNFKNLILSK